MVDLRVRFFAASSLFPSTNRLATIRHSSRSSWSTALTAGTILGAGERAPALELSGTDGESYSLKEACRAGQVLLAFFALDCQTCQLSFIHWDRIHTAYAGDRFALWGVSLDAEAETAAFVEKSGVEFPVLLDDGRSVEAYRLVSTPAHFLLGDDGVVAQSFDAFDRAALNAMIEAVAKQLGLPPLVIEPGEAPDFRPGCTIHA